MNRKRVATTLLLLIVQNLLGPCLSQRRYDHHHHHHDGYGRGRGGGGLLRGLGTAVGIAGAGLLAGAITRGITRGFSGGGGYHGHVAYPQPVVYPAYAGARYAGAGYTDPYYTGGLQTGYGGPYGAYSSPIVGGAAYNGGYPGTVRRRVTTVTDSLYPSVY